MFGVGIILLEMKHQMTPDQLKWISLIEVIIGKSSTRHVTSMLIKHLTSSCALLTSCALIVLCGYGTRGNALTVT